MIPSGIRTIGEEEIARCFPLMRQLRPHLSNSEEFMGRWRRQTENGYRLIAVWTREVPSALAGYRFQENLMHGRFLYVDDLVTDQAERRNGHGRRLLEHLKGEGRAEGCQKLVLDTGLDNVLGHRFYNRAGLEARALRFHFLLSGESVTPEGDFIAPTSIG